MSTSKALFLGQCHFTFPPDSVQSLSMTNRLVQTQKNLWSKSSKLKHSHYVLFQGQTTQFFPSYYRQCITWVWHKMCHIRLFFNTTHWNIFPRSLKYFTLTLSSANALALPPQALVQSCWSWQSKALFTNPSSVSSALLRTQIVPKIFLIKDLTLQFFLNKMTKLDKVKLYSLILHLCPLFFSEPKLSQ